MKREIRNLTITALRDLAESTVYQWYPPLPRVINMSANDICNSRCTMCNIWKQKKDKEITPRELADVFRDPLYREVEHIGITGGEPTLRKDLPELYRAACENLPSVRGLSIITNAISEKKVIDQIKQVSAVCQSYGKSFSIMVSLDGVAGIHDSNRGRKGNFDSAIQVIDFIKQETDIDLAIGCTITKVNVWGADELLEYLIENDIYGRFRIAEYIKRLYNEGNRDVIRAFSDLELYHLKCFFKRLVLGFEKNAKFRSTYESIISVLSGNGRTIGCPYRSKGVVLDSRGSLQYCAPNSKLLGNSINESGLNIFRKNLGERRRILKEDCSNCVHDYHAPVLGRELRKQFKSKVARRFNLTPDSTLSRVSAALPPSIEVAEKSVFVVGWFGTETVGDKAILAGIMSKYLSEDKDTKFYVASLEPFITERTLVELGIEAIVVPVDSTDYLRVAAHAGVTLMGGGPVMGIPPLAYVLSAFKAAKAKGKCVGLYGCGLGPFNSERFTEVARQILKIADFIYLRDDSSLLKAKEMGARDSQEIKMIGDPAKFHLNASYPQAELSKNKVEPKLALFLREWPEEYRGDFSSPEFCGKRDNLESRLAADIRELSEKYGLKICFYPMHTYHVGGDDRVFARRFVKRYMSDLDVEIYDRPSSVDVIVKAMASATLSLCMRFHSVVFAHHVGRPFVALDYTQGGKIKGFLATINQSERMVDLVDYSKSNHGKSEILEKVSAVL